MRRLLYLWILVVLSLVTFRDTPAANAQRLSDSFTFYAISGTQVKDDGDVASLRQFVKNLPSMAEKPTFVVAIGNLTETGKTSEFERFKEVTSPLLSAKIGLYGLPGKNDVMWSPEGMEGFTKSIGKTYQSFDYNGVHFVLLDSTVAQTPWGHFDKEQLEWLDRDIKKLKPGTPIFVFLHHHLGKGTPSTRVIDNEYEMLRRLHGKNVIAIFTGDGKANQVWATNGIETLASLSFNQGSYKVTVTPALITIDRMSEKQEDKSYRMVFSVARGIKISQIRAGWDDPDIPFLERRRPAATLEPRAVSDTTDSEKAVYRIDEGAWKVMTKDARDIWRDMFLTRPLAVGIHTAEIRITTSNQRTLTEELIFEVERNDSEPTRKWALDLEGPIQSNPVLGQENLYVSSLDGKVYALTLDKGKKRWVFTTRNAIQASPVVVGETLYIGSTDKFLYAVDIKNGKQRWKFDAGTPILSTAAVAKNIVCVGVHRKVIGVNANTGQIAWSRPIEGCHLSNPTTDGNVFYVGGMDTMLHALDAVSGEVLWSKKLGKALSSPAYVSNPLLSGDNLYLVTGDSILYALNTKSGNILWSVSAPRGGDPFGAFQPTVAGETLFLNGTGKNGDVYALNRANGSVKWRSSLGQAIYLSSPKLSPNKATLAVMTFRGKVVVLNTSDGKPIWGYELGPGNIFSTPEFDGNVVYSVTMANDVQALAAPMASKQPRSGAK